MARQSYSKEEKLKYVQLFAKSGLKKWEFVTQHPEIKRTTLYNWITKYFPNQPSSEGGDGATDEKAEISKDQLDPMSNLWLYHRQRHQCSYQLKRKDEKDFSRWSYRRIYARGSPSFARRFSNKSSKSDGL